MAYASVHQFTQALKTGGEANMPVSDDVTVDAAILILKWQKQRK
jgi:hypothetical protein